MLTNHQINIQLPPQNYRVLTLYNSDSPFLQAFYIASAVAFSIDVYFIFTSTSTFLNFVSIVCIILGIVLSNSSFKKWYTLVILFPMTLRVLADYGSRPPYTDGFYQIFATSPAEFHSASTLLIITVLIIPLGGCFLGGITVSIYRAFRS